MLFFCLSNYVAQKMTKSDVPKRTLIAAMNFTMCTSQETNVTQLPAQNHPKRWNMFFLLDDRQAGGKFILNDLIRALTFFRLRQGLWNNQTGFQVTCEHFLDLSFILDYVFK